MEKSATMNLRINSTVKKQAEDVLSKLGVPVATAVDMFLRQVALTGGIPFSISLPEAPFSINADVMTAEQVRSKLAVGYEDMLDGNVKDADAVFSAFREAHR